MPLVSIHLQNNFVNAVRSGFSNTRAIIGVAIGGITKMVRRSWLTAIRLITSWSAITILTPGLIPGAMLPAKDIAEAIEK